MHTIHCFIFPPQDIWLRLELCMGTRITWDAIKKKHTQVEGFYFHLNARKWLDMKLVGQIKTTFINMHIVYSLILSDCLVRVICLGKP